MPQIEPKASELKSLKGLHLWHAPLSSCSQRVRLTLAETNQGFESHLIDLERGEHASEAYQKIHPKGLVPALVDEGKLIIESVDIIQYLAKDHPDLLNNVDQDLLQRADDAQLDLKLLTFEFLFRGAPKPSEESVIAFQKSHQNSWLKQFYQDFAKGFSHTRIKEAVERTAEGFLHLETRLADGRAYLSGDSFTVGDIAWLPNFHRFDLMAWPWEKTPNLKLWFQEVSGRASYQSALVDWENTDVIDGFGAYTKQREKHGTSIASFLMNANG